MAKTSLIIFLIFSATFSFAQDQRSYLADIRDFREKYVLEHEVVTNEDKKHFRFFKADTKYKVPAKFVRITDTIGFMMLTSSGKKSKYFIYGKMKFSLNKKPFELFVYQSEGLMQTEKYADHLFIPFTDITTGKETYGAGRYIDLLIADLTTIPFILDFNKAYNPYCAYASGFNCPIPPRQNYLATAVNAGEKNYAKKIH